MQKDLNKNIEDAIKNIEDIGIEKSIGDAKKSMEGILDGFTGVDSAVEMYEEGLNMVYNNNNR